MRTENKYIFNSDTLILLCGRDEVLLDASDYEEVSNYQWSIGNHGYATYGAGKEQVLLHRLIVHASDHEIVDHKNRNKLDNRRSNLRICKAFENSINKGKYPGNNTYKGICKTIDGKWQAQIGINRRQKYLGRFDNDVEAAKAYDTAARELYGEYAYLNFPNETERVEKEIKHNRKLRSDEVVEIRKLHEDGIPSIKIATMLQRSYDSILSVVRGETYRHIKE